MCSISVSPLGVEPRTLYKDISSALAVFRSNGSDCILSFNYVSCTEMSVLWPLIYNPRETLMRQLFHLCFKVSETETESDEATYPRWHTGLTFDFYTALKLSIWLSIKSQGL